MTADERAALVAGLRAIPGEAREAIRQALLEHRREGLNVTVRSIRDAARSKRDHVGPVLAAYREKILDLEQPWDRLDLVAPAPAPARGTPPDGQPDGSPHDAAGAEEVAQLLALIDAATSPSKIAEVGRAVGRLVASGRLEVAAGRLVLDACREQRQGLADARKAEPPAEDERRMILASEEALQLAKAFDFLVNGRRRALVQKVLALALESDMTDLPNVDTGGAAGESFTDPVRAMHLDGYGEPIGGADDPGMKAIAGLQLPDAWERACRGELGRATGNA